MTTPTPSKQFDVLIMTPRLVRVHANNEKGAVSIVKQSEEVRAKCCGAYENPPFPVWVREVKSE